MEITNKEIILVSPTQENKAIVSIKNKNFKTEAFIGKNGITDNKVDNCETN